MKQQNRKKKNNHNNVADIVNPTKEFTLALSITPTRLTYSNPRRIMPLPPRFRTVMFTGFKGVFAASVNSYQAFCKLNCVSLPFIGGGWSNSVPLITTLQPAGLSAIFNSSLYNRFRVIASRLVVVVSPENAADIILTTISPSGFANTPATAPVAISQPYTTTKTISYATPLKDRTIINRVSVAQFLGVRPQAIQDDLSGQFIGNIISGSPVDPSSTHYWVVNFMREDGGSIASSVSFDVRLEHDVEFFGDDTGSVTEALVAKPRIKNF